MEQVLDSQEQVRAALEAASEDLSVEQLAELTGLHPNSVRTQLNVLVASGLADRHPLPATGRGRRRLGYRLSANAGPLAALAAALATELNEAADADAIQRMATTWAGLVMDQMNSGSPAAAVENVTSTLDTLGFDAEVSGIGDEILLRHCPYASLVREHPIVCEIHAAVVSQLIQGTGQPVSFDSLDVYPIPDVCVVRLRRPDLVPKRAIRQVTAH